MTQQRITKAQATKVFNAVKRAYKGDDQTDLVLVKDWDWVSSPNWTIIWESGPYEWTLDFAEQMDNRVFAEPYSGWALCLWPNQ